MSDIDWIPGPPPDRREWIPGVAREPRFPVGVLLDVQDRGLTLVGHINAVEGVCDDCPAEIDSEDILRRAFVWKESAS